MKTTLYIKNLKSLESEKVILKRLRRLKCIKNISFKQQFGTITFDYTNKADVDRVKHILSEIGFPPFGEKNLLRRIRKPHLKKFNSVR